LEPTNAESVSVGQFINKYLVNRRVDLLVQGWTVRTAAPRSKWGVRFVPLVGQTAGRAENSARADLLLRVESSSKHWGNFALTERPGNRSRGRNVAWDEPPVNAIISNKQKTKQITLFIC
jgi:hypothetical protein